MLRFFLLTNVLLAVYCKGFARHHDTGVWILHTVQQGEFVARIFNRYDLWNEKDQAKFWHLNSLKNRDLIFEGTQLVLPIKQFKHQAPSIRQTLGFNDYNQALLIQKWNEKLERNQTKSQSYKSDQCLWVRFSDLPHIYTPQKENTLKIEELIDMSLFAGKDLPVLQDTVLKGSVFYLISGHGGPDPGANLNYQGHFLCEDEYAYDVTLRLAKELAQKGAKVFMIVQDLTHGIRYEEILQHDKSEKLMGGKEIPLNQKMRLKQRTDLVNTLYNKHINRYKHHRCLEIHIDSRSKSEPIDVFFYHYPGSSPGRRLSQTMYQVFKEKYNLYQKGRGYDGEILTRKLFTLENTKPVTCYIELGNIQHSRDLMRIIKPGNRQALAEWMAEGLVRDKKQRFQ